MSDSNLGLLNVGCGHRYHPDWFNIDLVAHSAEVRQYDLRKGLPYQDNSFQGVYHSHVLEHLTPAEARLLLRECRRVLKPGGVIRVVVPNLEDIAGNYLHTISKINAHTPQPNNQSGELQDNHYWMTLELIDQMTRQRSGGNMQLVMRDKTLINRNFLVQRLGQEFTDGEKTPTQRATRKRLSVRVTRTIRRVRNGLAQLAVQVIAGTTAKAAFREGLFRQSGEIHRWMYDRISLARLLEEMQFESTKVRSACESFIAGFDTYQLDRDGEQIRKPDSLFMEAVKPRELTQSRLQRAA